MIACLNKRKNVIQRVTIFGNVRKINFPMLIRVLGWLLMIEGIFMFVPTVTSVIYAESDAMVFLLSAIATLATGAVMTFCIRPSNTQMAKREGFLLTALVWVVFSLFGMIPFIFSAYPLSVTDAFFETMSGFTTTGCSIFESVDVLSHGVNMWRCLTQWLGGMGIILFTLAVIPMLNYSGGMQMFNAEVTGITHEKLRPRISQTAKSLWTIYFVLTTILTLLLWAGPMDFFDSVCHSFSTVSTGGFSTHDSSIGFWNSDYVMCVVTVFMFLGGVNFSLMYKASHGDWRSLLRNDTFMAYIATLFVMYVIFVISIILAGHAKTIESVTIDPIFQIITTITSTGLTADNFENWGPLVLSLSFCLMFFGACAGSTSGGAKIDRLLYLLKNTNNELYRSVHPNSIRSVRINGNVMAPEVVDKVIAFLCIYVMVIAVGGIMLTAMGLPFMDAFFSSFSCVSNTGLGAGVTGYGGGYEIIPDLGKWVLSILMLIGRLEIFTVLILFTRAFWKK
ncbi:TrkH family potassium uptake protein [uncultured Muribaculum sp.]|uniref:TrkH family potassium uptake protein n=1 Tax=uncultured Muribaculum sp. TaxID=1918613 RepID=UPI0025D95197|nr:TrkH family potassium uptake protein [uncultured Muribaculum sp.]